MRSPLFSTNLSSAEPNMSQILTFTNTPGDALDRAVGAIAPKGGVFLLTDSNTRTLVLPRLLEQSEAARQATVIEIPTGDVNKNISSLTAVWSALVAGGATRRSLLVNLGGGMVTDLGGFAAATFKRGIPFINLPTTLLGAVDAAVGGKTGINFDGLKNEIGAFRKAEQVIISTIFFSTLPPTEMLSGYGEMLKHGLLSSREEFAALLAYDPLEGDLEALLPLLERNVKVKRDVVEQDPTEKGLRKALNLGHTPGHAFESWAMARRKPVPHGYAVAWGLLVDLILSHMLEGFPSELVGAYSTRLRELYGSLPIGCNDYDALIGYMRHDKKNDSADAINFTLLDAPGHVHLDAIVPEATIREALDLFRDLG